MRATAVPSDSYRFSVNGDDDFIQFLVNDDAVAGATNTDKQRIVDPAISGGLSSQEIQQVRVHRGFTGFTGPGSPGQTWDSGLIATAESIRLSLSWLDLPPGFRSMPRLPRLQYENAIYHIITRGDGRRRLFHDHGHYQRFTQGLIDEVDRSGWIVIAYCWMPNHIHALIQTPQPNLANGMQHWLSGYANWYAKRNRRSGHLYQGRYKAFPVEDEGYYWNLSRYIHLNPCNGGKPLASTPEAYQYSSYSGYARNSQRVDWIAYEDHHRYWSGLNGGKDPAAAYRKFVKEGMNDPGDPKVDRLRDWVYGGEDFLKRMLTLAAGEDQAKNRRRLRRTSVITVEAVMKATAQEYGVTPEQYCGFRSGAGGRDVAAYLCRQYTSATLAELSAAFGLGHPYSSSDLIKRARRNEAINPGVRRRIKRIEQQLDLKPESDPS